MKTGLLRISLCVAVATVAIYAVSSPAADDNEAKQQSGPRLFEQRVYTTADGKLPNLHARFRNHTNYLFVKHGMHLIGYWTPTDKPNTLVYILAYPNKEAREASWKAFMADPEWQRVWAKSKEDAGGAIVTNVESTFMTATDYSPLH
ncbi:MAG: NIPSNAP family protein [Planctomycetales bacterium]|nr:NIPSNAP family protein [Planctomycetales bacterium]